MHFFRKNHFKGFLHAVKVKKDDTGVSLRCLGDFDSSATRVRGLSTQSEQSIHKIAKQKDLF